MPSCDPCRLLASAAAGGALFIGLAAAAPETETLKASPRKAIDSRALAAEVTLAGDQTLKSLLAAGFDIINVDAPVGTLSARFILRRSTLVYSCEPQFYRSGADPNDSLRIVSAPCTNLTPDD